jgi:hypothetical protein
MKSQGFSFLDLSKIFIDFISKNKKGNLSYLNFIKEIIQDEYIRFLKLIFLGIIFLSIIIFSFFKMSSAYDLWIQQINYDPVAVMLIFGSIIILSSFIFFMILKLRLQKDKTSNLENSELIEIITVNLIKGFIEGMMKDKDISSEKNETD